MLMLILIVIIIIGLAAVVDFILKLFRVQMCIQEQIKRVNNIEDLVAEVRETGFPAIEYLKIDGVCTECIWYNGSVGFQQIEIKFKNAATTYPIKVSMPWDNVGGESCSDSLLQAGNTYTIEVQTNQIICHNCGV